MNVFLTNITGLNLLNGLKQRHRSCFCEGCLQKWWCSVFCSAEPGQAPFLDTGQAVHEGSLGTSACQCLEWLFPLPSRVPHCHGWRTVRKMRSAILDSGKVPRHWWGSQRTSPLASEAEGCGVARVAFWAGAVQPAVAADLRLVTPCCPSVQLIYYGIESGQKKKSYCNVFSLLTRRP